MNPTTHQERKELRKLHEAARRRVSAGIQPTRRQSHTRALETIMAANDEDVPVPVLLAMGRRVGLRPRHIRRAIAGKGAHGRVAHPFPRRPNRRTQRLGKSMTTIMTLVAKAVDAGWEPGDASPLTAEEMTDLRMARKNVVIPSVNLTHPKMYRDPAWAERLRDRAKMRRHVRDIKRRMTAPPDQLYANFKPRDPLVGTKRVFGTSGSDPDPFGLALHDEVELDLADAAKVMDQLATEKFKGLPKPSTFEEVWLTAREAAEVLEVNASTVRRWAKAGKFEETRSEGQLQISEDSVHQVRARRLTERS